MCIAAKCSWSFVYCVIILCLFLLPHVYCFTVCVYCCLTYFSCRILARSQYPEGPATGHLVTGFSWFPRVYKRMLRWFPTLQVATACVSCSPPDLNFLDPYFIFMYMHYNHCHRATAHLQLNILLLLLLLCTRSHADTEQRNRPTDSYLTSLAISCNKRGV